MLLEQQDLFDASKAVMNDLYNSIKQICESIFGSEETTKANSLCGAIDIITQAILLHTALSDGRITRDEVEFIRGLATYGDVMQFTKRKLDTDQINFEMLLAVDNENAKAVVDIIDAVLISSTNEVLEFFSSIDNASNSNMVLELIVGKIVFIGFLFEEIDGQTVEEEEKELDVAVEKFLISRWKINDKDFSKTNLEYCDIFNSASAVYHNFFEDLAQMVKNVFDESEEKTDILKNLTIDFDFLLQGILLECALYNNSLSDSELQFIQDISIGGDFLKFIKNKFMDDFEFDMIRNLEDQAKNEFVTFLYDVISENSKLIFEFLVQYDKVTKYDFYSDIVRKLQFIAWLFAKLDNDNSADKLTFVMSTIEKYFVNPWRSIKEA